MLLDRTPAATCTFLSTLLCWCAFIAALGALAGPYVGSVFSSQYTSGYEMQFNVFGGLMLSLVLLAPLLVSMGGAPADDSSFL